MTNYANLERQNIIRALPMHNASRLFGSHGMQIGLEPVYWTKTLVVPDLKGRVTIVNK